jgi:hypothetical protein
MSQVIIHVAKGGKTNVKVEGVHGGRCAEASRPYLEKMAGGVVSDTPTEEANLAPLEAQEFEEEQQ